MKKEDFMQTLALYLALAGVAKDFAIETYATATLIEFDKIPRAMSLPFLVHSFYDWMTNGMLPDKQPAWLHFKEGER